MSDNSYSQAAAQAHSIVTMVAALEVDYDRLEELRDMEDLDDDEREELEELESAANGCADYEEALQVIQEDALSVEVRSSWHSPGDMPSPDEFKILLCTGGPAVQIRGELGGFNEPSRAWLEHQDWFESWERYSSGDITQATLLTYCRQFYFGE